MSKVIYGTIKILELIHNPGITGPGRIVLGLAKNIDRKVFTLDVLCPSNGSLPDDLRKAGITVVPLMWRGAKDMGNFLGLWRLLRKRGYHVFHIHSGQLNAFGKLMARLLGITAVVMTEHLAVSDHRWIKNKAALSLHLALHSLSDQLVDKVIAVSDSAREAFITRQGMAPEKVETIYNGVDLEESGPCIGADADAVRNSLGIPRDAPVVASVGRLSPEKGQAIFVKAAGEVIKDHPNAFFLLVGEGPERQNLEALILESGLQKNVILTGFMKNVSCVLEAADIVVQPSFESGESFGLSIAEAMARAKPVVVSDIKCFNEIVSDGKNGLLFPPGDHDALAKRIRLLLADHPLRDSLGGEGERTVRERFDIKMNAARTQFVYKELLRQKGFILYDDHISEIKKVFLDMLISASRMQPDRQPACRSMADDLLNFLRDRRHNKERIREYVGSANVFLIERFLQFIGQGRIFLDPVCRHNCRLIKRRIKAIPVTADDYDQRIGMQSEQFQIDNYYEPQERVLKARVENIVAFVDPQKGERILDVGCGVGTFAFHCAKRQAVCAGVDYSQASVDMAKRLTAGFGLSDRATFQCCDISNGLPFADSSFDKIVCADFVEHIDDAGKKKLLDEIRRLLKPSGKAVIFTPNLLRENLGAFKERLSGMLGRAASETRLHFGLTDRFHFEKMLGRNGFCFRRVFLDFDRPYLAKIPVLKEVLSLNLLWVIEKKR